MYKRTSWAIWSFWFVRTLLAIGTCICHYSERPVAKALGGLFALAGAIIMFYGVISFLLQCMPIRVDEVTVTIIVSGSD